MYDDLPDLEPITEDEDSVSLGDDDDAQDFDREIAALAGLGDAWQVPSSRDDTFLLTPNRFSLRARPVELVDDAAVNVNESIYVCDVSALAGVRARSNIKSSSSATWLLDSGASLHFTNSLADFVEYYPLNEEIIVSTANGHSAAEGSGTVILHCETAQDGARAAVRIAPVYYMPELTSRLLSMGEFLLDGLTV